MNAECLFDAVGAINAIHPDSFTISSPNSLECVVKFTSLLSLDEIRGILANIPDGHVMERTVNLRSYGVFVRQLDGSYKHSI